MPTVPLHDNPSMPNDFSPDRIKRIRKLYGENTAEFSKRFNVSAKTVEAWEQGRRSVKGPACLIYDYLAWTAKGEEL